MTINDFYAEEYKGLLKYAVCLLNNYHDAEDAVSECFLKILKAEKRFLEIPEEKKKAYIVRTLKNVCCDIINERRKYDNEIGDDACSESNEAFVELKADTEKAIESAAGRYSSILKLKLFSELTVSEISYCLGMSENNVKSHIFRGKTKIRNYLGEKYA